ncbi:Laccase-2 [Psilocybe cubensis]|uniref:Laccase-2 n=2 Tax=Psilocybe cubensis TaxID=181762 RepID=A0ACB8GSU0_PSICU|nr:Laccase-2 [Psilocybe cubensis]KAH9478529.1 Laccase-2 [Psilocybe cubensis]
MRFLSGIVVLLWGLQTYAITIGPSANLYIGNKVIAPDGNKRSTVLAGASFNTLSFPGPVIRATKGDTLRINVVNQLTDTTMLTGTSIHWHGLHQKGTSWADGVVGVTQCPIAPGRSFLYQFPTANQAGTFWYHSHYSTQYCDGLRGALVVYDPADPYRTWYDIDDETTIITLADWYHNVAHLEPLPAEADSVLINGKGRVVGGSASPLAVVMVIPNKRYRFRLVSISCGPAFTFSIDGHPMTVIEADSQSVQPLTVNEIVIFAGQRYSFILYANNPIGNYWIRSQPDEDAPGGFEGGANSAILRYYGAPTINPTTSKASVSNPLIEANLRPLYNPAAPGIPRPGAADVNIKLDVTYNEQTRKFFINNATFTEVRVPVLLQILSGARAASDLLPKGVVYSLPPNKVIEISMPGGSTGSPHPMHLHGHDFSVVRSAGSNRYNYVNPVRRDVVNIGRQTTDNVTIRFTTDNAGPWILHCHIDWHLEAGMAVVFAEDFQSIKLSKPPPAWDQLCPTFNALPPQTFH